MAGRALKRIKTDAGAKAAKPDQSKRQVDYRVEGVRGLSLRVTQDGTKTWSLRYRTRDGDQRRHTIGSYPEVSLAEARSATEVVLGAVAGGADPAKTRRENKAAARARMMSTVTDLIEGYFDAAEKGKHRRNSRPKRERTLGEERYNFERFIKPRLGNRPIADVTRAEVQRLIDNIEEKSPTGARFTRDVIRQAYNYAILQEAADRNPAALIGARKPTERERVLTDSELRQLWTACIAPQTVDGAGVSPGTALALRFGMVTLQRGGEVVGIHAGEIDRDAKLWVIPGSRTKNHRTHVVPLSDSAVDILGAAYAVGGRSEAWMGFAFPSPRNHRKPISRAALSRAMQRLCANRAVRISNARPHDFRRTGSTNITSERIGIPRFIVSRVLNQISDTGGAAAVTGVYDRNEYLPEKRRALDAWAALMQEIVEGHARADKVVKLVG